jgi:hypothetical protein
MATLGEIIQSFNDFLEGLSQLPREAVTDKEVRKTLNELIGTIRSSTDILSPRPDPEDDYAPGSGSGSGNVPVIRGGPGISVRQVGANHFISLSTQEPDPQPVNILFPVALSQVGGSQGTTTTAAGWTYDVTNALSGNALGSAIDPSASPHKWQRPTVGPMQKATLGYAHYASGDLVIGWTNEALHSEACTDV